MEDKLTQTEQVRFFRSREWTEFLRPYLADRQRSLRRQLETKIPVVGIDFSYTVGKAQGELSAFTEISELESRIMDEAKKTR